MKGNDFRHLLARASGIVEEDLTGFDFKENDFLDDELKSQYISYIFSCSVANILKGRGFWPSFVSGYSMGIYAALYYCGTVTFRDGLLLIKHAWELVSKATEYGRFGMGMIVGLAESDIISLLDGSWDVKICNQNNPHTFIISGTYDAVLDAVSAAKEEGALRANLLPAGKPYHSDFLRDALPGFEQVVREMEFRAPQFSYVSNISRAVILTSDGLREEVIRNLHSRMNWYHAMEHLLQSGAAKFFECGAGEGLTRNFRFIEGRFRAYSVAEMDEFLGTRQPA